MDGRKFVNAGDGRRWGLSWLGEHVESWIRPSTSGYRERRRQIRGRLRDLKDAYSTLTERGNQDVQ